LSSRLTRNDATISPHLNTDVHMNKPVEKLAVAEARSHFPALERWTYMDISGRSVLSREVRAAIDAHLDDRMLNGAHDKALYFELVERTRSRFAELIGAAADEITYTKNISEGLNMIATGVQWRPGDNVVLCAELEHPNNVYVSTVTFAPGFRTDVDALGKACRERDVLLLVDAAQSVGILHTEVAASNIDALSVSSPSMGQRLAWGSHNIERHVVALSHALARGFLDLGLPVAGGEPGPHLAQIVTVGNMSADQYATGDDLYNQLYAHLVEHRVKLSIRRGMLRFSLHVYNDTDDVERVLDLTRTFLKSRR
jgi:selenocysteine lyase/cysteine desulfurase